MDMRWGMFGSTLSSCPSAQLFLPPAVDMPYSTPCEADSRQFKSDHSCCFYQPFPHMLCVWEHEGRWLGVGEGVDQWKMLLKYVLYKRNTSPRQGGERRELDITANKLNNAQECSWAGSMTARPGELLEQSLVRFWHAPTSVAPGSFSVQFGSRRCWDHPPSTVRMQPPCFEG